MNRCALSLVLAGALALAGNEIESPDFAAVAERVADANRSKDVARITKLAKGVQDMAVSGENREAADQLAVELSKSLRIAKRDPDALEAAVDALGALRSKKGSSALKRIAFQKKADEDRMAAIQASALVALGRMADPRHMNGIQDQTKNRNVIVAKGAYASLEGFAAAKGSVRKRAAEVLMKGLLNEYPRYSSTSGKRVSPEKRKRWGIVSSSIIRSLQSVCHEPTITSADDWEQWWRENKRNARKWRDAKE